MTVPGPGLVPWALALVVFAASSAVLGGAVRTLVRRWVPTWRTLGPIERLVLDLYLGGAAVYAVALLPLGLFGAATFPALLALGLAYLLLEAGRQGRAATSAGVIRSVRRYLLPGPVVALVAAAGLGLLELALAISVPTGNTYDASQLGTYTALLIAHRSVPLTLSGAGLALPVVYPQGAAVWMGTAQLLFGLPAARTSVLVTPLFLGLAPLGGYVVGERWFGGPRAAATVAVALAVLATWTRYQVTGSYDFVLSFPLLLLVVGLSRDWVGPAPVRWSDAVAFGLLCGYGAALSPVGVGWWLVALPVAGGLAGVRRWGGAPARWFARYAGTLVASAVPVLPSLLAVAGGLGHLGFSNSQPGVGTIAPVGLTGPAIVGYADPFLFRSNAIWLSPFLGLHIELAALLVVGAGLLALSRPILRAHSGVVTVAVAGGISAAAWFLLEGLAGAGVRGATALAPLSNGDELAELLATVYVLVACVPIIVALSGPKEAVRDGPEPAMHRRPGRARAIPASFLVALLLLVPGVAVTATQFPSATGQLYNDFGSVSPDDFALLAWAPPHLPSGARVLVDPGSAAEFLTAYDPSVRVLYPMVVGFEFPNATYRDVLDELTNGTLAPNGTTDLSILQVGYIAVTGANTVLANPFQPAPLLAQPASYQVLFHSGDAYVFAVAPTATGTSG